jgi:AmmeMemoRadiSam system protein B
MGREATPGSARGPLSDVRRPVVAGVFYPGAAGELAALVDGLLDRAAGSAIRRATPPVALVAPHAGYPYSGPIAASAYAAVRGTEIGRVALLGPSHFEPLVGCAVPASRAWSTPLGVLELDASLREGAVACGAIVDDEPHRREHALEVQLPFLQRAIGTDTRILPVAVGRSSPSDVADLIEALLPQALVVISSDLSHYLPAALARRVDRRTADAVLRREETAIGVEDACGVFALRGLVALARRRVLDVELLDLRTSADTEGDPDRVVGYGAFAVFAPPGGTR